MSLKVFVDSPSHVVHDDLIAHSGRSWGANTAALPLSGARAGGNNYFSNKLQFASAGASDAPQAGIRPDAADHEVFGVAKLKQMQEQGQSTPRMDYSGTDGGVRWGALFDGLLFGKPVSAKAGSYHAWHQEGLFPWQSNAPKVVTEAALDASEWHALVAGLGAAPATGGLSLVATGGALLAMAIKNKGKKSSLPTGKGPGKGTFDAADLAPVQKEIAQLRQLVSQTNKTIDVAVTGQLGAVLAVLESAAKNGALPSEDAKNVRKLIAKLPKKMQKIDLATKERLNRELRPLFDKVAVPSVRQSVYSLDKDVVSMRELIEDMKGKQSNLEITARIIKEGMD